MIYTPLTVRAMQIAYKAHHGTTDANGVPYVFHPYHIAEQMTDEYTTCVALLHDVVEDTEVTIEQLSEEFPAEVVDAVALMTRDKNVPYEEYIRRIKGNALALTVKLQDIAHNMDETRIVYPDAVSEERRSHWREKYAIALKILLNN